VTRTLILAIALALTTLSSTAPAHPWGPGMAHSGHPPDADNRYGGIDEGDMRRGYGRAESDAMIRTAIDWGDAPPMWRPAPPPRGWFARLLGQAPQPHARRRRW